MKVQEYRKNEFPGDLRKLEFQRPNSVILNNPESFRTDSNTIYFGGRDWENITNDISNIEKNNREYFFLCLFTITIIDLTMFTYYKESYETFRRLTMYPKFGWSGFGPHYENPKKLLLIPENEGLLNRKKIEEYIDDYIDLLIDECNSFFGIKIPEITTKDFISKIVHDNEFQITDKDSNSVFEMVYTKIKEKINSL